MLKIYHNPRCSKSRQTLALLQERGLTPEIVLYLKTPLNALQIKDLQSKLGFDSVRQMMRKGEAEYKAGSLAEQMDENLLIAAIADSPKLLERPIVETEKQAAIGRPPEFVLSILN